MSYQHMDHAGWMESNNAAANRNNAKRKGWKPLPETLNEFQRKVCDIVGMVGGGIYNAPIAHDRIDWDYGWKGVSVVWQRGMSTFDYHQLTALVLLCHEARIRCSIDPAGPKMLRLSFWQRAHEGSSPKRHPNIDEAVAAFRAYLPADHRIIYRAPAAEAPGDATDVGVNPHATTANQETAMSEDQEQTGTAAPADEPKPADQGDGGGNAGDPGDEQPASAEA